MASAADAVHMRCSTVTAHGQANLGPADGEEIAGLNPTGHEADAGTAHAEGQAGHAPADDDTSASDNRGPILLRLKQSSRRNRTQEMSIICQ